MSFRVFNCSRTSLRVATHITISYVTWQYISTINSTDSLTYLLWINAKNRSTLETHNRVLKVHWAYCLVITSTKMSCSAWGKGQQLLVILYCIQCQTTVPTSTIPFQNDLYKTPHINLKEGPTWHEEVSSIMIFCRGVSRRDIPQHPDLFPVEPAPLASKRRSKRSYGS